METTTKFKALMRKTILIFLGIMLVFTMLSKTIYNFLLPVVKVEVLDKGKIETKLILEGKAGLDEKLIEKNRLKIEAPIGGQILECSIEEGQKVKQGEVLFIIEEENSKVKKLEKELERSKLLLEKESLLRQIQAIDEEIAMVLQDYEKQQEKINQITEDEELVELQEIIKKQEKEVALNQELYRIGAISKESYEESHSKWEGLKRKETNLKESKIENLEEEAHKFKLKEKTLINQRLELDKQSILNEKQMLMEDAKVDKKVVRAPISGYIYSFNISKQSLVEKGEVVGSIVSEGIPYRINFQVSSTQAKKIEVGDKVKWTLEQRKNDAVVFEKLKDKEEGMYTISCSILESLQKDIEEDRDFYTDLLVEVIQESGPYDQIVPNSAVIKQGGNNYIFIMEKQEGIWETAYKVRRVSCILLKEGDFNTAISTNIPNDAEIITRTSKPLKDGMAVSLE